MGVLTASFLKSFEKLAVRALSDLKHPAIASFFKIW